ncbi:MAG: ferrous iron transporter B, partial [Proteobacteria bacterium]|nr:ferrous iron transporter B [Pseudomonadota bacterium]
MALTQEISTLALVGSPNCGKTALFNALTGLHHKVANYPGVTVDWAEGFSRKQYTQVWKILDLPGTYSLQPQSEDEKLTRDILCGEGQRPARADLFLCVADATNLHLHLRLVLEVLALGQPTVLALNMMDQAEKEGLKPNIESLAAELGIPVVPISALRHLGLQELMQTVQETLEQRILPKAQINLPDAISRIRRVEQILQKSMSEPLGGRSRVTDQIDRWLLHPLFGSLALCLVFLLVFQAIFSWAALPQELLEKGMGLLGRTVGSLMPDGLWKSLLVDGLISGVGNVLVFLPQILILFFFLLLLEDSGYMARAAFILDRLMRRVGMNGRSVLPLVSGLACAIPSIMSTRIMGHRRERWLTILITPLMTCS